MPTTMSCAAAVVLLVAAPAYAQVQPQTEVVRTPEAVALQSALEQVCMPLIAGRDPDAVAKAAGLKERDGQWFLAITGRKQITVQPPGGANPNVCSLTVTYDVDGQTPLLELLDAWAQAKNLAPRRVREAVKGPFHDRRVSSWEGERDGVSTALVFSEEKTKSGAPVLGDLDQATVLLSIARAA